MHMGRRLFSLFCLLWSLCALVQAQPPKRLTATLDRTGALTLRFAGSQRVYAVLRPGLFESPWQFRTTTTGSEVGSAKIRLRSVKGTVAVTYEATLETTSDRHLHLKYTLTPNSDVQVNSVHLAFLSRLEHWEQAKGIQGPQEVALGGQPPKQASLLSGDDPLVLIQNETKLSIETKGQPQLLQDNRAFGTQELEIRVGKQTPEAGGRLWKAGQTETFETTSTSSATSPTS